MLRAPLTAVFNRYDSVQNVLISETEAGVITYPIIDGIPRLVPHDATLTPAKQ